MVECQNCHQYTIKLSKTLKVKSLSRVGLFATPGTVAYQAPLSIGLSRQQDWSGLPFLSPADLPDPGIKHGSPALQTDALPSEPPGKSYSSICQNSIPQSLIFSIKLLTLKAKFTTTGIIVFLFKMLERKQSLHHNDPGIIRIISSY